MRTLMQLVTVWVAVALSACSVKPATFMLGDGQNCQASSDCSDPACVGASVCQPVCGNGIVDPGEECDDGNATNGDTCDTNCTTPRCGNGAVDPSEQCDDGNTINSDGCDNNCAISALAYLKASNTGTSDFFGYSIALSTDGSTLAVGAYGEASAATGINGNQADNSADSAGAVYVFTRSGTTWSQQAYLKASNTGAQGGSDPERSTVRALDLGPGVADAIVLVIGREEDQARWHAM